MLEAWEPGLERPRNLHVVIGQSWEWMLSATLCQSMHACKISDTEEGHEM